jgi:hypothetical protein
VSLPWRNAVTIVVGAHRLGASVWRRRWAGLGASRLRAQAEVSLPGLDTLGSALDTLLADIASRVNLRGAFADFELADPLVTLDVIEGEFADHTANQLQIVARACMAELLGEASTRHELRWQLQRDERHLLICALKGDTLTALVEPLQRHGMRLGSVQPRFCSVWNRQAGQIARGTAVFAVADESTASMALVDRGVIKALGHAAWIGTSVGALDAAVDRLRAGVGVDDEATRYLLSTVDALAQPPAARWTLLPTDAPTVAIGSPA